MYHDKSYQTKRSSERLRLRHLFQMMILTLAKTKVLSVRVIVKTINQRYSSCIFLTTVPNFTSTEEPNYQLQFTVYCIANWYQVTACLDDSSRWIWNASLGIGLIIFRLRVGMGGGGEGRSEDFNYISIKLTRPLPPPPRLCIILMTPPPWAVHFL